MFDKSFGYILTEKGKVNRENAYNKICISKELGRKVGMSHIYYRVN